MDGIEQSHYVAVYRARQQIDAVITHDQTEQAKRDSRKGGRSKYGKR